MRFYLFFQIHKINDTLPYIHKVTAPQVAVAGLLLPWLGFLFGAMVALLCRRKTEEIIAISIETGIQNTGIAIGVLKVRGTINLC